MRYVIGLVLLAAWIWLVVHVTPFVFMVAAGVLAVIYGLFTGASHPTRFGY